MSNPNENGPGGPKADEPLSPEALDMFSKARRSFGISIGILLLGFMAIGVALVYRVMRDAPPPAIELKPVIYVVKASGLTPLPLWLGPAWLECLNSLGYTEMTPIQAQALPVMLAGGDVMGQASTGTGKTAAFGLALLAGVEPASQLPRALVLCPTRELARQVSVEIRRLAWALPNTNVVTVCGGESIRHQIAAIENGVDVVVGTPGRVLDLLERETLDLSRVATVVLDEADRMLDMGFIEDVATIVAATPGARQTIMMSATMTPAVREVSERFQSEATFISVVSEETEPAITQLVYAIEGLGRLEAMERILGHHRPASAVIFCNERATCDEVVTALRASGHSAETIHGGLEQRERDDVLVRFSNGSLRLMVATDVAARGIDVEELDVVINYELPYEVNSYVHRIGRTGRAGQEGLAITLADSRDLGRRARFDEELARLKPLSAAALPAKFAAPQPAERMTVVIQGGRKDKLRPGDIVGALTGELGVPNDAIGRIIIHDRVAFVAVSLAHARAAVNGIKQGRIKRRNFNAFLMR